MASLNNLRQLLAAAVTGIALGHSPMYCCSDAVIKQLQPSAYWPLDADAQGRIQPDNSSNGRHALAEGQPAYRQTSLQPSGLGLAVRVSAGNRFVAAPFLKWPSTNPQGYTVTFWLRVNAMGTTFANIVGDGESGSNFYMMQYLRASPTPGMFCLRPHAGANNAYESDACAAGSTFGLRQTVFLATIWDRGTGRVTMQQDSAVYTLATGVDVLPLAGSTGNRMFLGMDNRGDGGADFDLDEVAFFSRPLSLQEVESIRLAAFCANSSTTCPSPFPTPSPRYTAATDPDSRTAGIIAGSTVGGLLLLLGGAGFVMRSARRQRVARALEPMPMGGFGAQRLDCLVLTQGTGGMHPGSSSVSLGYDGDPAAVPLPTSGSNAAWPERTEPPVVESTHQPQMINVLFRQGYGLGVPRLGLGAAAASAGQTSGIGATRCGFD